MKNRSLLIILFGIAFLLIGLFESCELDPDFAPSIGEATCSDGILNGTETEVDCGGSCMPCDSISLLANFEFESLSCSSPFQIQFNNSSSTDATGFSWSFGDGNTSSLENPDHAYTQYGSYTVRLELNDGSSIEKEVNIEIKTFELNYNHNGMPTVVNGIIQNDEGNYVIVGTFNNDILLLELNGCNELVSTSTLGSLSDKEQGIDLIRGENGESFVLANVIIDSGFSNKVFKLEDLTVITQTEIFNKYYLGIDYSEVSNKLLLSGTNNSFTSSIIDVMNTNLDFPISIKYESSSSNLVCEAFQTSTGNVYGYGYASQGSVSRMNVIFGSSSFNFLGQTQWKLSSMSESDNMDVFSAIQAESGVVLTGYFTSSENSSGQVFFLKGGYTFIDIIVEKEYSSETAGNIGSTSRGIKIINTSDGGYLILGQHTLIDQDLFLLKLTSNGDFQWSQSYGGTGTDTAGSVIEDINGGYVFVGTRGQTGSSTAYVVKTDTEGNIN